MSIPQRDDPIGLFQEWLEDARRSGMEEPTAGILATSDATGRPSARAILLKQVDARGFVFYTNLGSRKARELRENPRAALCVYWMPLSRQVCVEGPVEPVSDAEVEAYFATRPRESQIGAWASRQSEPLTKRLELERRVVQYGLKFGLGKVPRPEFWSGFRLVPERIEFWLKCPFRLHERLLYTREGARWTSQWLYP